MNTNSCPKCGSNEWERGKSYPQGALTEIRFKADEALTFSIKKQVVVFACRKCGFIEFYLADHDD